MEHLIDDFKLLLGEEIAQNVALAYIKQATACVKIFCGIEEIDHVLERIVLEVAVYLYRKAGIEGTIGYKEGNLSYSYSKGIPQEIKDKLYPFVKGKVISL